MSIWGEDRPMDGPNCRGCGLPNYSGLCPVCRGDYDAYQRELEPHFGPWWDQSGATTGDER
jgi:hypothetical protein